MRSVRAAALVLSLVAAGCGSSDEGASTSAAGAAATSGGTTTRTAYVARGDAICRGVNARIAATNARIAEINRSATSVSGALADAAPLLADSHRIQRASVAAFRALPVPAGDEATVNRIVAGIEEQVALVGRIADAAQAGDAARMRALSAELRRTRARVRGLLQGYGFGICGRSG